MCDQFKNDLKQTKKRVCVCGLWCVCVTLYVRHVCVSVCDQDQEWLGAYSEVCVCLRLVVCVCAWLHACHFVCANCECMCVCVCIHVWPIQEWINAGEEKHACVRDFVRLSVCVRVCDVMCVWPAQPLHANMCSYYVPICVWVCIYMCVCGQVWQLCADVYLRVFACVLHSSLPRAVVFGAITCFCRASSCVCVTFCVSDVVRVSTCVCVCVCVSAGAHRWAKLTCVYMMFCMCVLLWFDLCSQCIHRHIGRVLWAWLLTSGLCVCVLACVCLCKRVIWVCSRSKCLCVCVRVFAQQRYECLFVLGMFLCLRVCVCVFVCMYASVTWMPVCTLQGLTCVWMCLCLCASAIWIPRAAWTKPRRKSWRRRMAICRRTRNKWSPLLLSVTSSRESAMSLRPRYQLARISRERALYILQTLQGSSRSREGAMSLRPRYLLLKSWHTPHRPLFILSATSPRERDELETMVSIGENFPRKSPTYSTKVYRESAMSLKSR